jgi:hypothetical protein
LMRHFEIKSALWNFLKMTSSKIRYFTGACTFREHICIVRHGGQPFWYNLGAGVDVRGQTHVPARHFSLQSAYQSAGPGHSEGCCHARRCALVQLLQRSKTVWTGLNGYTNWLNLAIRDKPKPVLVAALVLYVVNGQAACAAADDF